MKGIKIIRRIKVLKKFIELKKRKKKKKLQMIVVTKSMKQEDFWKIGEINQRNKPQKMIYNKYILKIQV